VAAALLLAGLAVAPIAAGVATWLCRGVLRTESEPPP
jgi:hypothetical protein